MCGVQKQCQTPPIPQPHKHPHPHDVKRRLRNMRTQNQKKKKSPTPLLPPPCSRSHQHTRTHIATTQTPAYCTYIHPTTFAEAFLLFPVTVRTRKLWTRARFFYSFKFTLKPLQRVDVVGVSVAVQLFFFLFPFLLQFRFFCRIQFSFFFFSSVLDGRVLNFTQYPCASLPFLPLPLHCLAPYRFGIFSSYQFSYYYAQRMSRLLHLSVRFEVFRFFHFFLKYISILTPFFFFSWSCLTCFPPIPPSLHTPHLFVL